MNIFSNPTKIFCFFQYFLNLPVISHLLRKSKLSGQQLSDFELSMNCFLEKGEHESHDRGKITDLLQKQPRKLKGL